jgi:hypothetical protein
MLFKFPSSQAPREVVPRMINKERILFPMHIRCTIPRGDAVCLIAADMQIPQNVSVGHGAEAVLCPLCQCKLWKRTSFIFISFGAGFRDPEYSGEVVSSPLHIKVYGTSLFILFVFNNYPFSLFSATNSPEPVFLF